MLLERDANATADGPEQQGYDSVIHALDAYVEENLIAESEERYAFLEHFARRRRDARFRRREWMDRRREALAAKAMEPKQLSLRERVEADDIPGVASYAIKPDSAERPKRPKSAESTERPEKRQYSAFFRRESKAISDAKEENACEEAMPIQCAPCAAKEQREGDACTTALWDDVRLFGRDAMSVAEKDKTFQEKFFEYLDASGLSDPAFYKSVNMSRQTFSKIRGNREYQPNRENAILFCIRLQLDLEQATDLLSRAGFALNPCSKGDMYVKACLHERFYDISRIDQLLEERGLPTLMKYA